MSSLSLPQLFNGTIPRRNRNKHKYMSIDSRRSKVNRSLSTFEEEFVKKRKPLSKNGTIPRNTFRGVHRDEIERTAKMICHNMTVSFGYYTYIILIWFDLSWDSLFIQLYVCNYPRTLFLENLNFCYLIDKYEQTFISSSSFCESRELLFVICVNYFKVISLFRKCSWLKAFLIFSRSFVKSYLT